MPTLQGAADAFDHGFDVPADYDAVFGTPTAVASPAYQGRVNSLQIDSPGNEGVRKNISGSPSRGFTALPVIKPSNPASDVIICALHSVTSNIQARIVWDPDGNLVAYIGGGTRAEGQQIPADTWAWIEAIYKVSAATHELFWRINGFDQPTASVAATGSDSVDYAQILSASGNGALTWHAGGYWIWGSAAADNDWHGEPRPFASVTIR